MSPSDRNDGDIMGALGVYGELRQGEGVYRDVSSRSVPMSIDSVSIGWDNACDDRLTDDVFRSACV